MEPDKPNWETANGFTAQAGPLWARQAIGAVLAAPFLAAGIALLAAGLYNVAAGRSADKVLPALGGSAAAWLAGLLISWFHVMLGWRVVDELDVDFKTRALRLAQRRVRGKRVRTVEVGDLESAREVSYGSYRGEPLDWFEFNLKSRERIRFRCPPEILTLTRRALQQVGLLDDKPWKGKAVQPARAADGLLPPSGRSEGRR